MIEELALDLVDFLRIYSIDFFKRPNTLTSEYAQEVMDALEFNPQSIVNELVKVVQEAAADITSPEKHYSIEEKLMDLNLASHLLYRLSEYL